MGERQHLRPVVESTGGGPSGGYDVVIVGASIAGCTAATLYGRSGLRVALLERASDPAHFKTLCTHIIQPSADPVIKRLGLDEHIARGGGIRPPGALWTRWGWVSRPEAGSSRRKGSDLPELTYSIRREKLDPMLRDLAAGTTGVDLLMGHTVVEVLKDGGRVTGVFARTQEGSTVRFEAPLVVAADGRNSAVAELAGVGNWKLPNRRSGYWAYYKGVDNGPDPEARLWFMEPDIGYAFPTDDDLTILVCMFPRKKLDWFKQDLAGNLERLVGSLPDGPDLSNAERVTKVMGLVDLPNRWRKRPPGGLVFVGDAAVAADPLFGVGCGWAFQSAEWLADSTASWVRAERSDLDRATRAYRGTVRRRVLGHYLMTSDFSTGRRYNPFERVIFSAAPKDDFVAERVHQLGYRQIPVRKIANPVVLGRSLWANITKRTPAAAAPQAFAPAVEVPAGAPIRRGTLEVDGVRSPYLEAGPRDASEAVVFVHGNPGSGADWEALVGATGTFARAVAIDHPGFGRADKPEIFNYTVAGYGAHLGRALEALGIRKAHLVLHDFGGPWGLAWAAAHPEALGSLVLIDTGVMQDYRWHYMARIWQTPVVGEVFNAMTNRLGFRSVLKVGQPTPLPLSFVDRMYAQMDKGTKRAILRLTGPRATCREPHAILPPGLRASTRRPS
jgi:2-polyprenyl-6-methoxyphenol hydroxylase-like FAD-dependent oxidoreductase/pimeloyl-ACP methyl ester carboxylesterase